MWCRRTLTAKELAAAKEDEKRKQRSGKKTSSSDRKITKKTRVPCINLVQHVVFKLNSSGKTSAFQLHSPTQAIAKANWATMLKAIKNWSLHCCGEVGQKLDTGGSPDSDDSLQNAANGIKYIGKCKTQDDAGQNRCILAREQAAAITSKASKKAF
jgi:hypothetical protein